ncbi:MAG: pentapeptide repeat-containing protein [Bdellovibrionales bacterium]|jgi:uncharacterized protein YjbI with pentapeptide repeats|nr:pentapeptide repeat-containing protein [Bdellovibrionales bacterium]
MNLLAQIWLRHGVRIIVIGVSLVFLLAIISVFNWRFRPFMKEVLVQEVGEGEYRFNYQSRMCENSQGLAGKNTNTIGACSSLQGWKESGIKIVGKLIHISDFTDVDLSSFLFDRVAANRSTWTNAVFARGEFVNVDLERVVFKNVVFENVDFTGVLFSQAEFINCEFRDSLLRMVNFHEAVFRGSRFVRTKCERCDFRAAKFVEGSSFDETKLLKSFYNERSILPFKLEEARQRGLLFR